MALLIVSAQAVSGAASPGTAGPAFLAASVTDADGRPVAAIPEAAFTFFAVIAPGGVSEPMTGLLNNDPGPRGLYMFSLFRGAAAPTDVWDAGSYVVSVAIADTAGQGQALAAFHISSK